LRLISVFFTDLVAERDLFTLSRSALFFSMLLLFPERVFSTFLLVLSVVERRCAFVVVAAVTAARVIINASSLNFIVFMTSYF
jgi:hypothetical protein